MPLEGCVATSNDKSFKIKSLKVKIHRKVYRLETVLNNQNIKQLGLPVNYRDIVFKVIDTNLGHFGRDRTSYQRGVLLTSYRTSHV